MSSAAARDLLAEEQALARLELQREDSKDDLGTFVELTSPTFKAPRHLAPLLKLLDESTRRPVFATCSVPPRHYKTETLLHAIARNLRDRPHQTNAYGTYSAEFAEQKSRRARDVALRAGAPLFPKGKTRFAPAQTVNYWQTTEGGGFLAVGRGSGFTGHGVSGLLVVDDPLKDRVEAESARTRQEVWDWFADVALTRVEETGSVIVTHCLAGDTRVTLADGTEKPIRDIRPGDMVASYDAGTVRPARVLNWANQGPDRCYTIKTRSGIAVTANERHPFLVERDGCLRWLRLREIVTGDKMLRAVSGRESSARAKVANGPPSARDSANRTITSGNGPRAIDRRPSTPELAAKRTCASGTESGSRSTKRWKQSRAASAPSASNLLATTFPRAGAESSASTIATIREPSEACCATTAISSSDEESPRTSWSPPPATFETALDEVVAIVAATTQDVFDIQVEGTENFFADGLCSHNTRWHEDDLIGRIRRSPDFDDWAHINLPATALEGDSLGRPFGAPLLPEKFTVERLKKLEARLGAYSWWSLYQGEPRPRGGKLFGQPRFYHALPSTPLRFARGVDLAYTAKKKSDWSVQVFLAETLNELFEPVYYVLQVDRRQVQAPAFGELLALRQEEQFAPVYWRAVGPEKGSADLMTSLLGVPFQVLATTGDKFVHAQPFAAAWNAGRVFLPAGAVPWVREFVEELTSFTGVGDLHDDQVDAAVNAFDGLQLGQALDYDNEFDAYLPQLRMA